MPDASAVTNTLQQRFGPRVLSVHSYRGQETLIITREGVLEIARFLKDDPTMRFDFLMDLTCVDYLKFGKTLHSAPTLATPSPLPYYVKPSFSGAPWQRLPAPPDGGAQAGAVSTEEYRFDLVYHFYSSHFNRRVRLKVPLALADPAVPSLTPLWPGANWFEREVWDMFGITFAGHPNLRRLLLYEEFKGHPLRKDYPVRKRQPLIGPVD